MKSEVITIGDEILYGHILDTNARFISQSLAEAGIPAAYLTSCGDSLSAIQKCLAIALKRAEVIVVTGGLGPTHDDVTREAVAGFYRKKLVFHSPTFKRIQRQFRARKITLTPSNRRQAYIPQGANALKNTVGNAAGFIIKKGRSICAVMPGVPREMKVMTQKGLLPYLKKISKGETITHHTIRTFGIGESSLFEKISKLKVPQSVSVAYLPRYTGVDVRLTVSINRYRRLLQKVRREVSSLIKEYIYGKNQETLEQIIGTILKKKGQTLAIAESCTGGLIGDRITSVPGSSRYFKLGVVAYSNQAKSAILGVPQSTLQKYGAVSEETALAMAQGVKKAARAGIGIATTGIAGPGGASKGKPVGMVCIGLSLPRGKQITGTYYSRGNRNINKTRFAQAALFGLFQQLKGGTGGYSIFRQPGSK